MIGVNVNTMSIHSGADRTLSMIVTIVAIAAVFMVECIKADDGYSVFTSFVTDSN